MCEAASRLGRGDSPARAAGSLWRAGKTTRRPVSAVAALRDAALTTVALWGRIIEIVSRFWRVGLMRHPARPTRRPASAQRVLVRCLFIRIVPARLN